MGSEPQGPQALLCQVPKRGCTSAVGVGAVKTAQQSKAQASGHRWGHHVEESKRLLDREKDGGITPNAFCLVPQRK